MAKYWVVPHDGALTSSFRKKRSGERMFINRLRKLGPFESDEAAVAHAVERDFSRVDIICEEGIEHHKKAPAPSPSHAPLRVVTQWLFSGETGASSMALAAEYLGCDYHNSSAAPLDPADLGRCLRLIKIEPRVRECVDRLALKHSSWAAAAKCWDEIAECMEAEVGADWSKGKRAERTYKLMKARGL